MILITGAGGFIGRNLTTYLHEKGEHVIASGRREHDEFFSEHGIPYVKLDFSKHDDYSNIEKYNIRKIIHLAAIVPTKKKIHSTDEYISINGNGVLGLLDYCVQNNVTKFVNTSSVNVYGAFGKNSVKENANLQPYGAYADYAIAKILSELFTERYAIDHKLNAINLRLGFVFDFQKEHLLLPRLIKSAIENNEIIIQGSGKYIFDVLYIDDAISAIDLAIKSDKTGVYNIGGGVPVTLNDIAQTIAKQIYEMYNKKIRIVHIEGTEDKTGYSMNIEKAEKDLGFVPQYLGKECIVKVIHDYLDNHIVR